MFLFGHMGIGSRMVKTFTAGLPRSAVLVGAILPDLLDKPIYYSLFFLTGKHGSELGLISGTRTFGHTALFTALITLGSFVKKSRVLAALALGAATHLLLDNWADVPFAPIFDGTRTALLWPFTGWSFPVIPFSNINEHLSTFDRPWIMGGEAIGLGLLAWDRWARNEQGKP